MIIIKTQHKVNFIFKYLIVFFSFYGISYSQAPLGEIQSIVFDSNGDTLVLNRQYGDFWYGVYGGINLLDYFGDLNVYSIPGELNNPFNRIINYNSGSGKGYFFGGIFEYNPKGENWGYQLKLNFYDLRNFESQTIPINDSLQTNYEVQSVLNQITISPTVRYNLPIEGLHLYSGLNLEIARAADKKNKLIKRFVNGGDIYESNYIDFNNIAFGYGLNIGFGFDFMIADISRKSRAFVTPFAELQLRSSMINDNSSNWLSMVAKFGFQVKLGADQIVVDTLYFDPTYVPPPQYLAQVNTREKISFDVALNQSEDFIASYINYIPIEKTSPEEVVLAEASTSNKNNLDTSKSIVAEIPQKPQKESTSPSIVVEKRTNIEARKGVMERFSFPKTESISLTEDMKSYLNKVAEYLKKNPGSRVLVVGHSDMSPSLEKNTLRARQRAKNVEKYLLSLGIPQGRIIASWKGTLFAVAPNDTEEGRYKNRRVEITIE